MTGSVCLCESVCKGADGLEVAPEIRETSVSLSLSLAGLLAHRSKKLHLIRADRVKRDGGWVNVVASAKAHSVSALAPGYT